MGDRDMSGRLRRRRHGSQNTGMLTSPSGSDIHDAGRGSPSKDQSGRSCSPTPPPADRPASAETGPPAHRLTGSEIRCPLRSLS
jgi:hypothetical protein